MTYFNLSKLTILYIKGYHFNALQVGNKVGIKTNKFLETREMYITTIYYINKTERISTTATKLNCDQHVVLLSME